MLLQRVNLFEVKPVVEVVLNQVERLGIDEVVGQCGVEGVLYALHLKRQPTAVACRVGEELAFVATGAEGSESHASLLGIAICCTLIDIGGGDDGLHGIEFAWGHGVKLIHVDESELGNTQAVVLAELVSIGKFAAVRTQVRWDEVLQPSGLEDTLAANEHEDLMIDYLVLEPRGDHGHKPFLEALAPGTPSISPFKGEC